MFYRTTKTLKLCLLSGRQCLHFYQIKIIHNISIFCKLTSNFTKPRLLISNKSKSLCPQGQNQMVLRKACETCFGITLNGSCLIFCVISKFWILFLSFIYLFFFWIFFLNMKFDQKDVANFLLPQEHLCFPSTRIPFY